MDPSDAHGLLGAPWVLWIHGSLGSMDPLEPLGFLRSVGPSEPRGFLRPVDLSEPHGPHSAGCDMGSSALLVASALWIRSRSKAHPHRPPSVAWWRAGSWQEDLAQRGAAPVAIRHQQPSTSRINKKA